MTSVHPGGIRTGIVKNSRMPAGELRDRQIEMFERRGTPPEKVADKIVRAILRNQLRLVITPEAHLLDFAKRILPAGTQHAVARLWSRYAGALAEEAPQR